MLVIMIDDDELGDDYFTGRNLCLYLIKTKMAAFTC